MNGRAAVLYARAFPTADAITLSEWRRLTAGVTRPAPYLRPADTWPICPTCGAPYPRNRIAARHDFCSRTCRLRWQAAQQRRA